MVKAITVFILAASFCVIVSIDTVKKRKEIKRKESLKGRE